jgi:hypothetical protein
MKLNVIKTISWILALLFLAFAFFQFNDPDPVYWILLYGFAAVVSVAATAGYYHRIALWFAFTAYTAGAVLVLPTKLQDWLQAEEQSATLEMTMPFVEEGREAVGLLVCALAMVFHLYGRKVWERAGKLKELSLPKANNN